jgi:hypothetical protein
LRRRTIACVPIWWKSGTGQVGLDPFALSEVIDKKLAAIQKLVAKGPVPKPTFHPDWGRKKKLDARTFPGIPTTTLSRWDNDKGNMVKRMEKQLRKERFLQTV